MPEGENTCTNAHSLWKGLCLTFPDFYKSGRIVHSKFDCFLEDTSQFCSRAAKPSLKTRSYSLAYTPRYAMFRHAPAGAP
jgi:hypothetical protein